MLSVATKIPEKKHIFCLIRVNPCFLLIFFLFEPFILSAKVKEVEAKEKKEKVSDNSDNKDVMQVSSRQDEQLLKKNPNANDLNSKKDSKAEDRFSKAVEALNVALDKNGLRGNWVKKLAWLKQAAEAHAEIISLKKEVLSLRSTAYEPKISSMREVIQKFYVASNRDGGIGSSVLLLQNDVDDKLKKLLDLSKRADLENFQQNVRFKIYDAEDKLSVSKNKLSLLKMDIGVVDDLYKTFQERVALLDSYIKKAVEIEAAAEAKAEELFFVVDHDKARDIFMYVQGIVDQMKAIHKYIKEDAFKLFDSEQTSLTKETSRLSEELDKIKNEINTFSKDISALEQSVGLVKTEVKADVKDLSLDVEAKESAKVLPRRKTQTFWSSLFGSEMFLYFLLGALLFLILGSAVFLIRWLFLKK